MTAVRRVERGDATYPEALETIADPPPRLWINGSVPPPPAVAIVGTRRATRYGMTLARRMGQAVGTAGWPVISGLARGVDGAAHRGCLEAGGAGVAVLGCGIDIWYPPEHQDLGHSLIAAGGGVVSEYPPGTRPEPWRFPARNRIISGLAAAAVVVEAAEKGGALITARLAAEQGRDVFAVPGDVDRRTSVGTNLLIRDGAVPVLGPDDLVEALTLVLGPSPGRAPESATVAELDVPGGAASLEEVVEVNGGDVAAVLSTLGRLEAEGKVKLEEDQVFLA